MSQPKLRSDLNKIQKIEEALTMFFNTNGRLPYPAYYKDTVQSENYLKENSVNVKELNTQQQRSDKIDAKVLFGVVPTRTLGLDDEYAYDSYGKNIEYVVDSTVAEPLGTEHNKYKKSNYNPNNNGQYAVSYVNSEDEKDTQLITPNLSVSSIKNNQMLTNNAGYILLSKQKQNKCFVSARNNQFDESLPSENAKLQNNCFVNDNIEKFYQGYNKDFDEMVAFSNLKEMVYKASNASEVLNEITQGDIIQYQPRIDKKLETKNKSVVGAINEVNWKVRFIPTFNGVVGEREQLYYLYSDDDSYTDSNGQQKHYTRGLYIYNEDANDPSLNDFKLVSGSGGGVPVGSVVVYSGKESNAPNGFLWCDGARYNKLSFPELYAVIGEAYTPDAEKGGLDFRVPDLRDKIPWQSDSLSGSKEIGTAISAGVPNITGRLGLVVYANRSSWINCATATGPFRCGATSEPGYKYFSDYTSGNLNNTNYTYFNANNGASTTGIYRDDAKTVQPPALSMRYMIRYTADEEKAKEVFDFSEEVRRQLAQSIMEEEIKKQICEKTYPIGSIYINASDNTNPEVLFGCGTWVSITANRYLMAAGTDLRVASDYDAYNNRYGNYAGIDLNECISNIRGSITNYLYGNISLFVDGGKTGAFYGDDYGAYFADTYRGTWGNYSKTVGFTAETGAHKSILHKGIIYKDNCQAIRPQTYPVYIWQRIVPPGEAQEGEG